MTAKTLIERLQKVPPELEVISEGCDCVGVVEAVYVLTETEFATRTIKSCILLARECGTIFSKEKENPEIMKLVE